MSNDENNLADLPAQAVDAQNSFSNEPLPYGEKNNLAGLAMQAVKVRNSSYDKSLPYGVVKTEDGESLNLNEKDLNTKK